MARREEIDRLVRSSFPGASTDDKPSTLNVTMGVVVIVGKNSGVCLTVSGALDRRCIFSDGVSAVAANDVGGVPSTG